MSTVPIHEKGPLGAPVGGPGRRIRAALRYVAQPALLLAAAATAIVALQFEWNPGLVGFSFLLFSFGYLAVLERIIPYDRAWLPEAWEWRRDGLYFVITMIVGAFVHATTLSVGVAVAPLQASVPLWVELPAAMLLLSLCSFLFHRLSHHVPWLWRVHGIHHTPSKVNVSNNNLNHFLDVVFSSVANQIPLLLLGISAPVVLATMLFTTAQFSCVHANIDSRLGWLNYLLATPEQHRLHHSVDPDEAGHYAFDLPLWDLVFRSFTWAPHRKPRAVGLRDPATFPPPRAILASLAHPFRRPGYLQRSTQPLGPASSTSNS